MGFEIALVGEDHGHEVVVAALVRKVALDLDLSLSIQFYSVRGGRGRAFTALRRFIQDLNHPHQRQPDLLIVAVDGNCKGFVACRKEVENAIGELSIKVVLAVPDPHIERWLLVDSAAFKAILGVGCEAPDQKCERDRYKMLLANAVKRAGLRPLFGGLEHAEKLIEAMTLDRAIRDDPSLRKFVESLRQALGERS